MKRKQSYFLKLAANSIVKINPQLSSIILKDVAK
jgi:hypothetical protein